MNKIDVLAIAAHPDDIEITCSGLLMRMSDQGYSTGALDLTRGEMGSKGTAEIRTEESIHATKIMGLSVRENAELEDARLTLTDESRDVVATLIRTLRPELVILPSTGQRHPDHNAVAEIAYAAIFAAGLKKYPVVGEIHHPKKIIYATSYQEHPASFYVDISGQMDRKLEAVAAYQSQFGKDVSVNQDTEMDIESYVLSWARCYGSRCGVKYAEPYWIKEAQRIDDPIKELRLNSV
jgi:bacillithiol biosynthesis deacetylase BshB1